MFVVARKTEHHMQTLEEIALQTTGRLTFYTTPLHTRYSPPPSYQVLYNPLHTRYSPYENSVRKERGIRKREVLLSRLSVYIVVLMVSCHAVRIIPTIWEIIMTVTDQADITQASKTWL